MRVSARTAADALLLSSSLRPPASSPPDLSQLLSRQEASSRLLLFQLLARPLAAAALACQISLSVRSKNITNKGKRWRRTSASEGSFRMTAARSLSAVAPRCQDELRNCRPGCRGSKGSACFSKRCFQALTKPRAASVSHVSQVSQVSHPSTLA